MRIGYAQLVVSVGDEGRFAGLRSFDVISVESLYILYGE